MTGAAGGASLCVALDEPDRQAALALAEAVSRHVDVVKVGMTAFNAAGPDLVTELARAKPVFADLKLHDIPTQVEGGARALSRLGVDYLTVHAAGGVEMMRAAIQGAGGGCRVLAVTILTSLDDADLDRVGIAGPASDAVARLAAVAVDAGVDGLVCSPRELAALRERFGSNPGGGPLLVVPGIRRREDGAGDQKRTTSPAEAARAGADVVVVGRPITAAPDPGAAACSIKAELAGA